MGIEFPIRTLEQLNECCEIHDNLEELEMLMEDGTPANEVYNSDDPLYGYRLSFPSESYGEDGRVDVTVAAARAWARQLLEQCDRVERAFNCNELLRRKYQNLF